MEDDTLLPTKVSPFGARANFSLSAFPTICFGAETLKDDGCALRDWEPRTPPTQFSHPRLLPPPRTHAYVRVHLRTEDDSGCVHACGCCPAAPPG